MIMKWFKRVINLPVGLKIAFQKNMGRTIIQLIYGVKINNPSNIKLQQIINEKYVSLFEEER